MNGASDGEMLHFRLSRGGLGSPHPLPLPLMNRLLYASALLAVLCPTAPATEWQDLKAQYQVVTVIGGAALANGDNNPNEWNNAEGQPATAAELSEPHSAMQDIYGRVFIADKNANAIRRIDPNGTIHTVAGMNLNELPAGSTTNAGYNGDGPARQRLLSGPQHAYVMPDGTFYIVDTSNFRIRRVDTAGNMTTIITDPVGLARGLWVRRDGQLIYYCTGTFLKRWTPSQGSGPGTVMVSGFLETGNIDVDAAGHILVSDRTLSGVYRIPPTSVAQPLNDALRVAGLGNSSTTSNGPGSNGDQATTVGMEGTRGVACHPLGGFFVATHKGGDIWYVDADGEARVFVEGDSNNTNSTSPEEVPTSDKVMSEPRSVSVALNGDVLIACNDAGVIRRVKNILPAPAAPVVQQLARLSPNGFRLGWTSEAGLWYLVERAASPAEALWQPLATLPSAGSLTQFTDTAAPGPRLYYRVRSFRGWPN